MIVYNGLKQDFLQDVESDTIAQKIEETVLQKLGRHTVPNEFYSWVNSYEYMYKVMNDTEIPNEAGCIHTTQGLEFDYVGVIIGDDMRFSDGHVLTDYTKRAKTDQSVKGLKKLDCEDSEKARPGGCEVGQCTTGKSMIIDFLIWTMR